MNSINNIFYATASTFSFAKKLDLTAIKKMADDIPAAPKTMHITIIWYLAAIKGETPDNICPVIIPGIDTRPTAKSEFVIGISEARSAMFRASSYVLVLFISAANRSAARLTLFIAFAKIIPASGIM
jgi:hypothetical protein